MTLDFDWLQDSQFLGQLEDFRFPVLKGLQNKLESMEQTTYNHGGVANVPRPCSVHIMTRIRIIKDGMQSFQWKHHQTLQIELPRTRAGPRSASASTSPLSPFKKELKKYSPTAETAQRSLVLSRSNSTSTTNSEESTFISSNSSRDSTPTSPVPKSVSPTSRSKVPIKQKAMIEILHGTSGIYSGYVPEPLLRPKKPTTPVVKIPTNGSGAPLSPSQRSGKVSSPQLPRPTDGPPSIFGLGRMPPLPHSMPFSTAPLGSTRSGATGKAPPSITTSTPIVKASRTASSGRSKLIAYHIKASMDPHTTTKTLAIPVETVDKISSLGALFYFLEKQHELLLHVWNSMFDEFGNLSIDSISQPVNRAEGGWTNITSHGLKTHHPTAATFFNYLPPTIHLALPGGGLVGPLMKWVFEYSASSTVQDTSVANERLVDSIGSISVNKNGIFGKTEINFLKLVQTAKMLGLIDDPVKVNNANSVRTRSMFFSANQEESYHPIYEPLSYWVLREWRDSVFAYDEFGRMWNTETIPESLVRYFARYCQTRNATSIAFGILKNWCGSNMDMLKSLAYSVIESDSMGKESLYSVLGAVLSATTNHGEVEALERDVEHAMLNQFAYTLPPQKDLDIERDGSVPEQGYFDSPMSQWIQERPPSVSPPPPPHNPDLSRFLDVSNTREVTGEKVVMDTNSNSDTILRTSSGEKRDTYFNERLLKEISLDLKGSKDLANDRQSAALSFLSIHSDDINRWSDQFSVLDLSSVSDQHVSKLSHLRSSMMVLPGKSSTLAGNDDSIKTWVESIADFEFQRWVNQVRRQKDDYLELSPETENSDQWMDIDRDEDDFFQGPGGVGGGAFAGKHIDDDVESVKPFSGLLKRLGSNSSRSAGKESSHNEFQWDELSRNIAGVDSCAVIASVLIVRDYSGRVINTSVYPRQGF